MSSYICSELYRTIRNKWTWLFIGICSLLLVASNLVLAVVNSSDETFRYATTKFAFGNVEGSMAIVYILCLTVTGIVFSNEYTNHTLKNSISYGITRGVIYFGKFFVEIVYAVVAFAVIIGLYVLSSYLLLEDSGTGALYQLLRACLASVPLLLFGLAVMNCFAFVIETTGGSTAAACGVMMALPLVCNLLGMKFGLFLKVSEIMPWNILNSGSYDEVLNAVVYYWDTAKGLRNCWIIGISETVLILVIGYLGFHRKEVR